MGASESTNQSMVGQGEQVRPSEGILDPKGPSPETEPPNCRAGSTDHSSPGSVPVPEARGDARMDCDEGKPWKYSSCRLLWVTFSAQMKERERGLDQRVS